MWLSAVGFALGVFACRDVTAPIFGSAGSPSTLLNPSGAVVVSPGNLHGWTLSNDQTNTACTDGTACLFVQGPGTPPVGSGSAELATPLASDGKALVLADYKGTRFDAITDLHYATYRQSADAGNNLAIALQFNVDYDLTDQATGYQGRVVFEPYQGIGGNVPQTIWQTWDAKAGKWWGTKASVPVNGALRTNACVQATPCTWTQLLAAFPNIGVHATYGAVVLKAGSAWPGFRGNVDKLTIGVSGTSTTFDFELSDTFPVPMTAPDTAPTALWDSITAPANLLHSPPGITGSVVRDLVYVRFRPGTTQSDRQAAIDLVHGRVVGGMAIGEEEQFYAVRILYLLAPGDSTSGPILRAQAALSQLPTITDVLLGLMDKMRPNYVRPHDGPGFRQWPLTPDSAHGPNWAQIAVDAPFAWGCSNGQYSNQPVPSIAIADVGFYDVADLHDNLGSVKEFAPAADSEEHGTAVASVLGAVGGNNIGMTPDDVRGRKGTARELRGMAERLHVQPNQRR